MVLGIVKFASKKALQTEIEKNISYRYDRQIETIKSDLRKSEEALKLSLKSQDDQVQALRSGALAGITSRQTALHERRLRAIEKLWLSVIEQNKLKSVMAFTATVRLDRLAKMIKDGGGTGQKAKEFLDIIWKTNDLENYKFPDLAAGDRPFIPVTIWAPYIARSQILSLHLTLLTSARIGYDIEEMVDKKQFIESIKLVLPHQAETLEEHGLSSSTHMVEEIEQKILEEIDFVLSGHEADRQSVDLALAIIKQAEAAVSSAPNAAISSEMEMLAQGR